MIKPKRMKEIVQLEKYQYEKLVQTANSNQEYLNKKALELYEEKGTFGITLTIDIRELRDEYGDEKITFHANSYVQDWNGKFPISNDDKRKIVKFTNERVTEMMIHKFGKQVTDINHYNTKVQEITNLKTKFIIFTLIGWLVAIFMFIATIVRNG